MGIFINYRINFVSIKPPCLHRIEPYLDDQTYNGEKKNRENHENPKCLAKESLPLQAQEGSFEKDDRTVVAMRP